MELLKFDELLGLDLEIHFLLFLFEQIEVADDLVDNRMKLLGINPVEKEFVELLDVLGGVESRLVERVLEVVEDVDVGRNCVFYRRRRVLEIEDKGVLLLHLLVAAVKPGESLHGDHPLQVLVHVHAVQERLVKAGEAPKRVPSPEKRKSGWTVFAPISSVSGSYFCDWH